MALVLAQSIAERTEYGSTLNLSLGCRSSSLISYSDSRTRLDLFVQLTTMRQSAIAAHLLKSCKSDQRVSRAIVAHQPVYLRSFGLLVLLDANLVSYSCLRFLKALLYCCWKPNIWAYFACRMLPKCLYYTFIQSLTDYSPQTCKGRLPARCIN